MLENHRSPTKARNLTLKQVKVEVKGHDTFLGHRQQLCKA